MVITIVKTIARDGYNIELLSCGHKNNLSIDGRITGKCPKGCE